MKNELKSWLWAGVGGVTIFILACCPLAMALTAYRTSQGREVTPRELDIIIGIAGAIGFLFALLCRWLFLKGKLPGYMPEK